MDKYSSEELVKRMHHPAVPVAVQAIKEIGLRNYKPAIPDLIELCYANVRQIRTAAMFSLGIMGAGEAIKDLNSIVWDNSKRFTVWDKIAATNALGNIPSVTSKNLSDIAQYHPNAKVAAAAVKAIEKRPVK
jgi:HEAT repeat protein